MEHSCLSGHEKSNLEFILFFSGRKRKTAEYILLIFSLFPFLANALRFPRLSRKKYPFQFPEQKVDKQTDRQTDRKWIIFSHTVDCASIQKESINALLCYTGTFYYSHDTKTKTNTQVTLLPTRIYSFNLNTIDKKIMTRP